ncbi:unnamed protein product, partial [Musa hybrid cultivar]
FPGFLVCHDALKEGEPGWGVLSFLHSLLSFGTFWRRLLNVLCFSVSCQGY